MKPLRILHLTPGTGNFHCGSCLRDNALVRGLRARGHDALMVPLYLPQVVEEPAGSPETPIFLGGISVFLDQKYPALRGRPEWIDRALSSPALLRWISRFAGMTSPRELGESTVSMLRGEHGAQARELDRMLGWLREQPKFDAICLSNSLLTGMAHKLKQDLRAPIVCTLQGEDSFLDGLPEPYRAKSWELLAARCKDVDRFASVSHYFADLMRQRLGLEAARVSVVYPGVNADDFSPASQPPTAPAIGYLARLHPAKGLDALVEAFLDLKRRNRIPGLRLRAAGAMTATDERFVESLRGKLAAAGFASDVDFLPNVDRAGKAAFLRSLSVLSVPALYGEAFGLYVLEALAAGVPVVQPRHAAFPEVLGATGGGTLYDAGRPAALADALEAALLDLEPLCTSALAARETVRTKFSPDAMTQTFERLLIETVEGSR